MSILSWIWLYELSIVGVVLRGRIELPTSPLPMVCSTTELPQHSGCHLPHALAFRNPSRSILGMSEKPLPDRTIERKKREAEALKANIKKRKEQAALQRRKKRDDDKIG